MCLPCNLILSLRVRDDLLVFEHENVIFKQLVVCCRAAKSGFFGAVGPVRIFAVLEIKLDFFEPVFTHEFVVVFFAYSQVTSKDDGVD